MYHAALQYASTKDPSGAVLALTTIAKWLGHSVKVMLEHYGRIQQSDYDQIAEARERVKRKKEQPVEPPMGNEVVHYISLPVQNGCESTPLISPNKASL